MKRWYILASTCIFMAVVPLNARGVELALGTQEMECRNCLARFENNALSIVHFYDTEKMEQLKRLQALGYMQGSDDYAAQLLIPYTFSTPEVLVKIMISSLTQATGVPQYIIISLLGESNKEIAREQITQERYNDIIKNKTFLTARLKTFGSKKGLIAFKFAGIKHVRVSKIEIE